MTWGRALALAMLGLAAARGAHAQVNVRVEAPAQARSAELLRAALERPHVVIVPDSAGDAHLASGTVHATSVIVIGRSTVVEGVVRGDVTVVGGDLFIHPGAVVEGRALAIGGGVYASTRASIALGARALPDERYDARREDGALVLARQVQDEAGEPWWELPYGVGLRIPEYTRVDGIAVPWGPVLRPVHGVEIDPLVTYRSHLGAFDPSVRAELTLPAELSLRLVFGRGTSSNDRWIVSDPWNSLMTILVGDDIRNYYRADQAEATIGREWTPGGGTYSLRVGAASERAWSTRFADTVRSVAWSIFEQHDTQGIARTNPPIDRGRVSSALALGRAQVGIEDVALDLSVRVEGGWSEPTKRRFVQTTADLTVAFPTFGAQRFSTEIRGVATGGRAPRQRFVYIGGPSSLPTVEQTLPFGGDALFFTDNRYEIPLTFVRVRTVGSPVVTLRYLAGSAGVGRVPALTQNLGIRLALGFLRADYFVDPDSRATELSVGFTAVR